MSKKTVSVKLVTPMMVKDKEVTELEIRKPNAGNLRGLNLVGVCELNFDTAMTLLPRISDLNERDVLNMEPENFPPLMTEIASFFVDMKS